MEMRSKIENSLHGMFSLLKLRKLSSLLTNVIQPVINLLALCKDLLKSLDFTALRHVLVWTEMKHSSSQC